MAEMEALVNTHGEVVVMSLAGKKWGRVERQVMQVVDWAIEDEEDQKVYDKLVASKDPYPIVTFPFVVLVDVPVEAEDDPVYPIRKDEAFDAPRRRRQKDNKFVDFVIAGNDLDKIKDPKVYVPKLSAGKFRRVSRRPVALREV